LSLDYTLRGRRHWGSKRTPDYAISLEGGNPTIVLEVGFSQSLGGEKGLKERAKMWLHEKDVRLVIIVDLDVTEAEEPKEEFQHCGGNDASQPILPYGLTKAGLEEGDFETIVSTIMKWYESRQEKLLTISHGVIYLYRRPPGHVFGVNDPSTIQPTRIVFFDSEEAPIDSEACLLPDDFKILDGSVANDISLTLPLEDLNKELEDGLAEQTKEVAEKRAEKIIKDNGF
jgi:hypothetical protein